jgi:glycosyltransferase involved in cell wall biosynthesis
MTRVAFLIGSLARGGAERQLSLLVREIDHSRFKVVVVTIYSDRGYSPMVSEIPGVELISVNKGGKRDRLPALWRLLMIMRQANPQIIHGYMTVANVLSLVLGRILRAKVVWGLRSSTIDFQHYDRLAAGYFLLAAWLSRFADMMIVNSHEGMRSHVRAGYAGNRMVVVPNGFDIERFLPDGDGRTRLRQAWGISPNQYLIGLVGRMHPIKDHPTFLRAAALLCQQRDDVRFVCVGNGPAPIREELQLLAERLGLADRVVWTGEQDDMPAVYSALDVLASTSISEGFSNAVGEAMACDVPCVVSDVGDSAYLVGDTGIVVPPESPEALSAAWSSLLEAGPERMAERGSAARQRIASEFSLVALARRTEDALANLVSDAT